MARSHSFSSEVPPLKSLPSAALRVIWKEGYTAKTLRADILAGLVVGVVALPLAMALAIGVGVAPQYGLYTSIVAGFLVPLLGGSRFQVTGPTAAFIVILAPIFLKFGLGGLLFSGFLAGIILLAMGVGRLGKLIQFIPHPVTVGFTAGIGTVIAALQLKDMLGLHIEKTPEHFIDRVIAMIQAAATFNPYEFAVGLTTLLLLIFVPKVIKKVPAPLIALTFVTITVVLIQKFFPSFQVATIGSRFHTTIFGKTFAGIPQLLPQFAPPWSLSGVGGMSMAMNLNSLRILLPSAFAIAMLGAIESLLSAVVADGMAGTKHDPDSELIALGVGNMVCPFFGGIAATGAIARTATNIRYGGKSPVSAMIHALTILAAILLLAPILSYLPMASLAALLLIVAWNMSDMKHFIQIVKIAPRSDVTVLLTCYTLTVVFDMVVAVTVGIVLASLLFMQRMASAASASLTAEEHPSLKVKLPSGVILYEVAGPLFFGAADKAMDTLRTISSQTKAVIFYMHGVPIIDETGLVAFRAALTRLERQGVFVLITELQKQPQLALKKANIVELPQKLAFCATVQAAINIAQSVSK